jgi:hypothetical protein
MQPKCSASGTASTNNAPQTASASLALLHIPVERFKEICLRNLPRNPPADHPREITRVLDYFFDPLKETDAFKNDLDILKLYLTGGHSFETFKTKRE